MSNAPQTVVVYHSRWEADASEFWYEFVGNHPWLVLGLLGGFVALLLASWIVPSVMEWREKRKRTAKR